MARSTHRMSSLAEHYISTRRSTERIYGENIEVHQRRTFHMGTVSDVINWRNEGAVQQGPEVLQQKLDDKFIQSLAVLTQSYKSHLPQTNQSTLERRLNARIKAMVRRKVVVQDVRWKDTCEIIRKTISRKHAKEKWCSWVVGGRNKGGIYYSLFWVKRNPSTATTVKELGHIARGMRRGFQHCDDVDDSPENDLALNVDHVFEADECDAFDADVDGGFPSHRTMFMENLNRQDASR
ncbi:hypothetical protein Tco_0374021 [Tanacetum coccineum]